jgi:hypothetical protein
MSDLLTEREQAAIEYLIDMEKPYPREETEAFRQSIIELYREKGVLTAHQWNGVLQLTEGHRNDLEHVVPEWERRLYVSMDQLIDEDERKQQEKRNHTTMHD